MLLAPGTRLGPYEVLSHLGAGGMGEVYKARDTRLHREVAIKILPPTFASDEDRLRRFRLEAQSASSLNHPNILTVYDIGTTDQSPYIVMELLEGESLGSRLKAGKLGVGRAVDYGKQIAAGLAAAHGKGITHRDIKPDNLFITKDGRVKILDFGLAKVAAGHETGAGGGATQTTATSVGVVMGTAAYMSPEQARGQAADARSDIFSFGCVLYEMLTGERAFQGSSSADLISGILTRDPDESAIESPALARIVAHCLAKSPEERFQSASDIAFDLDSLTQSATGPRVAIAPPAPPKRNLLPWATAAVLALACAALGWLHFRPQAIVQFHRLTFRRGAIQAARFTPDGNGVIYSAKWEDEPREVFTARLDSPGSRALGFPGATLFSVSSTGQLALAQNARLADNSFVLAGMLARAPISGGAPRAMENRIDFADWSPKGEEMAVVRETDQGTQLEWPVGKPLYRTAGYISEPRISPAGDRIAFLDHPVTSDNAGRVAVVDRDGNKKTLTQNYAAAEGLAWAPAGDEIWFTAAKTGARMELQAVNLAGRERTVLRQSGSLRIHDIARDGRVLLANAEWRTKAMFRGPSDAQERELSWLDWSLLSGISRDGKMILIEESGEGAGDAGQQIYLRETNGAPAVLLGPAGALAFFSPDEQSVLASTPDARGVVIYPVGPGQPRRIDLPSYNVVTRAGLFPDGQRLWFVASEAGHGQRAYITDLSGAKPRPVTPEAHAAVWLSPDGAYFFTTTAAGEAHLYPTAGGEPLRLRLQAGERLSGWSTAGPDLFVTNRSGLPAKVYRIDWRTGQREFVREIRPSDQAGVDNVDSVMITPDGKAYAYSFVQNLSELHVVEGLK